MTIQTRRLLLRPFRESDAGDVYRLARDPLVGPAAGWQPHTDVENSRKIIREVLWGENNFALVDRVSGRVVGAIGIKTPNVGKPCGAGEAELGYWLGVPYWGRGLMPEAVAAVITYCFETLGYTALWCGYYEGNEKSHRVQEKCGFTFTHSCVMDVPLLGERRKCFFSRLTSEEYKTIQEEL